MAGYLAWSSVTPWALVFGLTGITCTILTIPAWNHRDRPGGAHAAALMVAAAVYSILYAVELQAPTLSQQIVWAKVEYLGVVTLPLAWFFFARSYTGSRRRLSRWVLVTLCAIPIATVIIVATNELHGLFWGDIRLENASPGYPGVGVYEHRVWFWVQLTYCYVLVLAGGFILVQAVLQYPNRYKWRATPLLLAALAPWVANALYSFGVRPAGGVNLTALAFSVTAVCVALSTTRFNLWRLPPALLPVAHETLFEQMEDLVVALDVDHRVVWANQAANGALAPKGGRLAGRPLEEVMTEAIAIPVPHDADDLRDPIEVSILVEGSPHVYDVACTPLRLGPGEDVGRLLVLRDISERRRVEAALRESEQRLRQSQRMEAIGRLAGGIAHDFNNLLTVILGYSEMILMCEEGLSDSARQDLTRIKQAAERAQGLTSQILAFARRQPREARALSPDRVVEDVAPLLTRTLGKGIELVLELTADDAIVKADPDQLTQVFMNLAVNAQEAMPRGGVLTIKSDIVSTALTSDAKRAAESPDSSVASEWYRVRVCDTGAGIDETALPHIFEPFFTARPQEKGSGLGLATVYGLVKQSNGDITVSSTPGEGTTFEIVLPIRGRGVIEPDGFPRKAPGTATRSAERHPEKKEPENSAPTVSVVFPEDAAAPVILLVEDEPEIRELAARTLREAGFRVVAVNDGPEALAIAHDRQIQIDLLLSDIVLPRGLRGDEVAQALRAERPGTRVLFVSGYPKDSAVYAEHQAADADYLDKPYTPESLARKVREIMSR